MDVRQQMVPTLNYLVFYRGAPPLGCGGREGEDREDLFRYSIILNSTYIRILKDVSKDTCAMYSDTYIRNIT